MSKQKLKSNKPSDTKDNTSVDEPTVEQLQERIAALQKAKVLAAETEIEKIAESLNVTVGVILDVKRLTEIMQWMITNGKDTVSLKFEVW